MRRPLLIAALLCAGCVDFGAALDDCAASGRCGPAAGTESDAGNPAEDSGVPGSDAGNPDSGCVDLDGDGFGPGCAAPDCNDGDPTRPLTVPCLERAHVCKSCPGASDSNSGSPSSPLETISQGIANARAFGGEVRVANADRFRDVTYSEDLQLFDGVVIVGGYYVEDDGGWRHPAALPTILDPSRPEGLYFPPGLGRSTRVESFRVDPSRDGGVAITIRGSSPTLVGVSTSDQARPLARTIAIQVETVDGGARASPLLIDVDVSGGNGATESIGINVVDAAVEVRGGSISGGLVGSGGSAVGLRLHNGGGSRVSGAELVGCERTPASVTAYSICRGLYATGDVTGVLVEGSEAYGCLRGCPAQGEYIGIDAKCGAAWDGGAPLQIAANVALVGARGSSNSGYGRGVRIFDGCAASIHDNAHIVGADDATFHPMGVRCARLTVADQIPRCFIARNTVVSHFGGASNDANAISCLSACDEVVDNVLDSHGKGTFHTLSIESASPLVARNRINFSQSTLCAVGRSVLLVNSSARVENNFIRGPTCQNAMGLVHSVTGPGFSALVHSNSITGGDAASTQSFAVYGLGPGSAPSGRYWNNILSTGYAPSAARAAVGFDGNSLPAEVKANLLHSETVGVGVHTVLGWGTGSPTYLNVNETNARPWGGENVNAGAAPGFVSWRDFHLLSTSNAIDAGTLRGGGPSTDIDGDPRPLEDGGSGYSPAMGADQP